MGVDRKATRSGRIERCVLGCGCGQKGNQEWAYREVCVGLWVWPKGNQWCVLGCGCGQKGNQEWAYREVCVGLWVWTKGNQKFVLAVGVVRRVTRRGPMD